MAIKLKRKEKIVETAIKRLDKAIASLSELQEIASDAGVHGDREVHFISELRERATYWEQCTWWKTPDK